ncbi:MAG: cell division protein ZapE [Gammaproteobacteria bacterium]
MTSGVEVSKQPQQSVGGWYRGLVEGGVLAPDAAQEDAVSLLQNFADTLSAPRQSIIRSDWRRFLGIREERADSLYLHGGVGRGKSFLMDGFFLHAPEGRKMRVHFHQFMQRFHLRMKEREGKSGGLEKAAEDIAAKCGLLCFDEFHISDIADAMILGRLMERLLAGGVRFVLTSNYHPDGLYPNGLARERFLPAIELIKRRFVMVSLDGEKDSGTDYRMRHFDGRFFLHPQNDKTEKKLQAIFDKTACGITLPPEAKAGGRQLKMIARAPGIAWFSFAELCARANGKGDYLSLADRFPMILLSGVPQLHPPQLAEAARRFTWLIDILYDRRIKLIISSSSPLAKLYGGGEGGESGRTLSRLTEMQSRDYWQQGKAAV